MTIIVIMGRKANLPRSFVTHGEKVLNVRVGLFNLCFERREVRFKGLEIFVDQAENGSRHQHKAF